MTLHLTKIAYRSESVETLHAWLEGHTSLNEARLTTRYLPKREAELSGGSLYWIHQHMIVGRSPILGFEKRDDGKYWIRLAPVLLAVTPTPRRAHQGWRYLAGEDVPPDLGQANDADGSASLPAALAGDLARLGLF